MFEGVHTAIVTPFNDDGSFDDACFRELVTRQIENGVDGIVPVGTTGESPTLDYDEHNRVIETAVDVAAGRIKVIAGTGANSTAEALRLTRHAKDIGANATLQVTPYYNKPSQAGLLHHFSAVAEIGLPTVLYNVPGRACVPIDIQTIATLADHPHVVAVKEAGGSVDRVSQILDACEIEVISGDDMLTLPMMMVGAIGVISVASNIIPRQVCDLVHEALKQDWTLARELHSSLHPLFCEMFIETNPVPVKTAMSLMGLCSGKVRLPLWELSAQHHAHLEETLRAYELI